MANPTHFLNIQIAPDPPLQQKIQHHQQMLLLTHQSPGGGSGGGVAEGSRSPEELPAIVAEENLHLTVGVLGLDDPGEEARVIQLLQDPETVREVRKLCEGATVTARLHPMEVFPPLNAPPDSRGPCAVVIRVNEAESQTLMRVVNHLRRVFAPFLRERTREAGLPFCPHVTLAGNCYYDNDPASLIRVKDGVEDFGECAVSKVYLSKLNDTTEEGVFRHHATLLLEEDATLSAGEPARKTLS